LAKSKRSEAFHVKHSELGFKVDHKPTEAFRQIVRAHATVGTDQSTIARILGIDTKTLRKRYREDLDLSTAKANAVIAGSLFKKAKDGDTIAMIFWLKTRARWHEKHVIDATVTHSARPDLSNLSAEAREELRALLVDQVRLLPPNTIDLQAVEVDGDDGEGDEGEDGE